MNSIELDRPRYNMDPLTVNQRRVAEENLSEYFIRARRLSVTTKYSFLAS